MHCIVGQRRVCAAQRQLSAAFFADKDSEMSIRRELIMPATIACLLFFAGSAMLAPAMADDTAAFDTRDVSSSRVQDASREQARQANEAAVKEAAEAIEADARLDLDIRMIGRTSVTIAGEV